MDKRKRLQRKGRNLGVILLSLPTLIWYVIFCYLSMFGIVIAFKRYKPIPGKLKTPAGLHFFSSGVQ